MFGRRRHSQDENTGLSKRRLLPSAHATVGIGSLVTIKPGTGQKDDWDGEPSGVVIATGDNEIVGYPGLNAGGVTGWLVSFDELAYTNDGRGPFEQATIPTWRLVPVAPVSPMDDDTA